MESKYLICPFMICQVTKLFWNQIVPWGLRSAYYLSVYSNETATSATVSLSVWILYLNTRMAVLQVFGYQFYTEFHMKRPLQPAEPAPNRDGTLASRVFNERSELITSVTSCIPFTDITSLRILFQFECIHYIYKGTLLISKNYQH